MNATITAKPTRRLRQSECGTPRHILNDAPEIQAAMKVSELMKAAFLAHGIATPSHMPNLGVIADAIAQALGTADTSAPMPAPPKPFTAAELAEHDGLIDN
jgi:hypothetical protein